MHISLKAKLFSAAFAIGLCMANTSIGQITINLPNFPKIKKNKVTTTTTDRDNSQIDSQVDNRQTTTTTSGSCSGDLFLDTHMKDLEKTRQEAASYAPGARDYYVSDYSDRENIYLKAALSPSRRQQWTGKWPANLIQCITPALDNLAEVAKKTLPGYTMTGYNIHNPAEERILRSGVNDIAQATVFKTGLGSTAWNISKDNYNYPTARYKYGAIWAKYSNTDDGFCRIIYVNLVQDYAGGGTYGESYGNFIKSEYAGCPPGK